MEFIMEEALKNVDVMPENNDFEVGQANIKVIGIDNDLR